MTTANVSAPRKNKKTLESVALGGEPVLKEKHSNSELIRALNWFNYHTEPEIAKRWVRAYGKSIQLPTSQVEYLEKNIRKIPTTFVSLSRMAMNGSVLSNDTIVRLKTGINDFLRIKLDDEEETSTTSTPVVRKAKDRLSESLIEFVENLYQEAIKGKVSDGLYESLVSRGCDDRQAKMLRAEWEHTLQDLRDKNDDQVKEGYKFLTAMQWKRAVRFLENLMEDLKKFILVKKASVVRKPRAKKAPKTEKLVAKVKIQREDTALGLTSAPVEKVVGSGAIYTFNTKTRVLTKYVGEKLSFKGTTLTGFDEQKSFAKKVRKPNTLVSGVCSGTQKKVDKFFDGLTTSATAANGRFNETTMVLRIF